MTLFDQPGSAPAPPRAISLVRLAGQVARAFSEIGRVTVEGEVVNPKTYSGGRTWFTLKDRNAQLTVSIPGSRSRYCRAVHGERVAVTGTVTFFPERGQVQLVAEEVTPVGAGAISALLAEVRARLAADGLIDRPRRPLPLLPRKVGVVCGAEAAVRADIESVVAERMRGYPVRFVEVTVSGPGAAEAIRDGLRRLCDDAEVEVVILARGGGDAAQLLPFSDESLCRAIAAAPVPVVVAIGHEGDRPVCDEVADRRCATPSLAAAAVIPSRVELDTRLDGLVERADAVWGVRVDAAQRRLAGADPMDALESGWAVATQRLTRGHDRLVYSDPTRRVAESRRLLERIDLDSGLAHRLARATGQLRDRHHTLLALDPDRVLARGYAVVRDHRGSVLRSSSTAAVGEELDVTLAEGGLSVTVTGSRR